MATLLWGRSQVEGGRPGRSLGVCDVCTHTYNSHAPESCPPLRPVEIFPAPGPHTPHLDSSQDLNVIKSGYTCSSHPPPSLKHVSASHRLGTKINSSPLSARPCVPGPGDLTMPTPGSPAQHTGPHPALLALSLHRTRQALCPWLEGFYLPVFPWPRHSHPSAQLSQS